MARRKSTACAECHPESHQHGFAYEVSDQFSLKKNSSIDKDLMVGFSMKMDAESSPTWYPKQAFFNEWKWCIFM